MTKITEFATPPLILDEMMLDAMSDAKLLDFAQHHYQRNMTDRAEYPSYYFDVDDANAFSKYTNDKGETINKPGYLMVKIDAMDKAFKYTRKVRYKAESERHEHFTYDGTLLSGRTDVFSFLYPHINKEIMETGTVIASRNGTTKEFLNFKTVIENPLMRCVGGFNRNINIFFLLAEAMWIVRGNNDVGFLTVFNKQMADYSDDGKTFHAPYGYRLRHYPMGVKGPIDQIAAALKMLYLNPEDRRVVASIWNPNLDLGKVSKDIPCNDMLMFKVRDGKLFQTIQNRSNDLHWGLPTNVFQFSFLGEIMAKCLGVGMGHQVHNSQSLHIYVDNPIAAEMYSKYENMDYPNLYDVCKGTMEMDFDWTITSTYNDPVKRLEYIDGIFTSIITVLTKISTNSFTASKADFIRSIYSFSKYFAYVAEILIIYVDYTNSKRTDVQRTKAIRQIIELRGDGLYPCYNTDIEFLAINFFVARLKGEHDIRTVNGNYGVL